MNAADVKPFDPKALTFTGLVDYPPLIDAEVANGTLNSGRVSRLSL